MDDVRVHTGTLLADLLLPHAGSLKERRGAVRSLVQKLRNLDFAVAQVGPAELTQRLFLAIVDVSGSVAQLEARLDVAERLVYASEFEVAALRRDLSTWSEHAGG
ncbi:MAG: DUF503 family protein [Candidatus Krumholzibacteriia bacterium]